ncbi:MAG: redoxin family protein [Actinomycetales bacterium]|nr:redoxin family protein [Actinomycetales bacterium]
MSNHSRRTAERAAADKRNRSTMVIVVAVALTVIGGLAAFALLSGGGGTASAVAGASGSSIDSETTALRPCPQGDPNAPATEALPAQSLPCLDGTGDLSFASLTGKPTIINVWASWCPPCVAELPWLAGFDRAVGDQVQMIGVDVSDESGAALRMLASSGVTYPSVFDPAGSTRATLGWSGTPVTYFIRPDGTLAYRHEGRLPDEATLYQLAAQYLGVQTS